MYVEYLAEQSSPTRAQQPQANGNSPAPKRPGLEHAHTDCLHGEVTLSDGEATKIVGVFVSTSPDSHDDSVLTSTLLISLMIHCAGSPTRHYVAFTRRRLHALRDEWSRIQCVWSIACDDSMILMRFSITSSVPPDRAHLPSAL